MSVFQPLMQKGQAVALYGEVVNDYVLNGQTAAASYILNSNGNITGDGLLGIKKWLDPATNPGDFYVRATKNSGTTPSGTLNAWISLSTSKSWGLINNVNDSTKSCLLTIEISNSASGTNILATGGITIQATVGLG